MKKIISFIHYISITLLIILTAIILMQVFLRNFFQSGFSWNEEAARLLMLSMVLIMTPVIIYQDGNVSLDIFSARLPEKYKRIHSMVILLLIILFFTGYIISHVKLMLGSGDIVSPCLNIPNSIYFSSALIGAVLSVITGIHKIVTIIKEGSV